MNGVRVVVVPGPDPSGVLQDVGPDGNPSGRAQPVPDLGAAITVREAAEQPRWVWPSTPAAYRPVLAAGGRVRACHDLTIVERLLHAAGGGWGAPVALPAAWARLHGELPPADPVVPEAAPLGGPVQDTLFAPTHDSGLPPGVSAIDAAVAVHADQLRRLPASPVSALLAGSESACALLAEEMSAAGLPWRADVHDRLLTTALGPAVRSGRPPRLAELAEQVSAAFGRQVNPDSPAELLAAFSRDGLAITSTRSWEIQGLDHPAVRPLLAYKELARLHAAHGWSWLSRWVHEGRFRGEYVVGGVVSGRWATRGGGALQIPKSVRAAVVADEGWSLVVADAAQLEPRVLAAIADDAGLTALAGAGDLYTAIAADTFCGDRAKAKVGILGTLYGATAGDAGPLLALLRRRFPRAVGYVEAAATAGEQGRLVRSVLGRTCPAPSPAWRQAQDAASLPEASAVVQRRAGQVARDRGRFTRNFVVQASAADWTAVLLPALRDRLAALDPRAQLVFFQHDEVIVHCPTDLAEAVTGAIDAAGEQATRLVFGGTDVRLPLVSTTVRSYDEAK